MANLPWTRARLRPVAVMLLASRLYVAPPRLDEGDQFFEVVVHRLGQAPDVGAPQEPVVRLREFLDVDDEGFQVFSTMEVLEEAATTGGLVDVHEAVDVRGVERSADGAQHGDDRVIRGASNRREERAGLRFLVPGLAGSLRGQHDRVENRLRTRPLVPGHQARLVQARERLMVTLERHLQRVERRAPAGPEPEIHRRPTPR